MSNNISQGGTIHIKALADKALAADEGIKIEMPRNDAIKMRQTFYSLRIAERKFYMKLYKENKEHPMYGKSPYDSLQVTIEDEGAKSYLVFKSVIASLSSYKITDIATGKELKPEDL